jgi:hypothetical protein
LRGRHFVEPPEDSLLAVGFTWTSRSHLDTTGSQSRRNKQNRFPV